MTKRRGFWAAIVAIVALGAAGGAVAFRAYASASDPRTVVKEYFAALADGRADDALALGPIPEGDRRFLTAEVLARQLDAGQIDDFVIGEVEKSGQRAYLSVSYTLRRDSGDPVIVEDTVAVAKKGMSWRLAQSAVRLSGLAAAAQTRVAFADVELPDDDFLLLPGALPLRTNAPALDFDWRRAVVVFGGSAPQVAPRLSAQGEELIKAAVDASLQACLDGSGSGQCPLRVPSVRYVPGSITGSVSAAPSKAISFVLLPDADGAVHAAGYFTVEASWLQLDFNNIASPASGPLMLHYEAVVYLVDPLVVEWAEA